jgi:hypothetical protein
MVLVESVDVRFEPVDVALLDQVGRSATRRWSREFCLRHVEFVFEASDHIADIRERVRQLRDSEPEESPELVVRPVGADPGRILLYARTAGKTGRASIARPGIETRDTLASGRHGSWSKGELRPWTGQYEMCSTSLCFASWRHSRQMNPLRSLQAIAIDSMLQPFPVPGG